MTNGKYVSIENIIAKVYRDLGIKDTMAMDMGDAIEWAGEAMDLIGATVNLIQKVEAINVKNYRGKLPIDLHFLETAAGKSLDDLDKFEPCDIKDMTFTPMRYTTDSYHHWRCGKSNDCNCMSNMTYSINDDYIFPNFEEGKILLSYQALPTDERGYPKIPDDAKFKEAVAAHVKWRIGFIRWSEGKMPGPVYAKLEQERDWYIGAAQNRDKMPSVDHAESLMRNWIRLIPKIHQHKDGFKTLGNPEQRYTHNS